MTTRTERPTLSPTLFAVQDTLTRCIDDIATLALQRLAPATPDYATAPIADGFNWAECLAGVEPGQWYVVVFRSVRRPDADDALLAAHDDAAYAEACGGAGLLAYFRGDLGPNRECLSLCVWASQGQARAAMHSPSHRAAIAIVGAMYESYTLERYLLSTVTGSSHPTFEAL